MRACPRCEGLTEGPEGLQEGSESRPEGPKGLPKGPVGMPGESQYPTEGGGQRIDVWMYGQTEFFLVLQDFVPY